MSLCQLGSIITNKASGGDEIPAELFQTLKDDIGFVFFLFVVDFVIH